MTIRRHSVRAAGGLFGAPQPGRRPGQRQGRPAPLAQLLRATTALTACGGLVALAMAAPTFAQTLPPNTVVPYTFSTAGTNANPGSDSSPNGGAGPTGGAGTAIGLTAQPGAAWISPASAGATPTILLDAAGGAGGQGGNSTYNGSSYGNGDSGGLGGGGGSISFQVTADPSSASTVTNQGTGPVLSIVTDGGAGGTGGLPGNRGSGGVGGNAGDAGAINTLTIQPGWTFTGSGAGATAILLQANGGAGGNGGENTVTIWDTANGPNGGTGGTSNGITANIGGTIHSAGSGIIATANGGAGGYGAQAGTAGPNGAYGGNGGDGGAGGNIQLTLTGATVIAVGASGAGTGGQITVDAGTNGTTTAYSSVTTAAVGAVSTGGTGGYGDYANATTGPAYGGNGGDSGNGGANVQITVSNGSLSTSGYAAMGAVAISAGSSGGSGGQAGAVFSRSGGQGGNGGDGQVAIVQLTNAGQVTTTGRLADGLAAMSIGGGGGFGGDVEGGGVGMSLAFGGTGGQGGMGGEAIIQNGYWTTDQNNNWVFVPGGVVSTRGAYARGIASLSVGGGGGRGGDANNVNGGALSFSIGGSGGQGGQGGPTFAENYGVIQTRGNHSVGIDAAGIGGGGGVGGAAHSYDISNVFAASVAVGGQGGGCDSAGNCPVGGTVTVGNYGQVLTMGGDAHGIRAQSIGGGGGHGGASVADNLMLNNPAQDVPTITLTASIGGNGGAGANGNTVGVANAGMLITQGQGASGILAQSIGGGGGSGGDSQATSQSMTPSTLTITTSIGGSGSGGGAGCNVTVANSGLIWTLNHLAPGIIAQSVGGGGGSGGYGKAHTGSYQGGGSSSDAFTANISVGGTGAGGGNGQAVSVYNYVTTSNNPDWLGNPATAVGTGGIVTLGDGSDGIYAHSIGGGGGVGGHATAGGGSTSIKVTAMVGGSGDGGGTGGTVLVDNGNGSIATYGANSAGIFAQSVGGGGGRGGTAGSGGGANPTNLAANNFMSGGLGLGGTTTNPVDDVYQWTGQVTNAFNDPARLATMAQTFISRNLVNYQAEGSTASDSTLTVNIGAGFSGHAGAGGDGGQVTVQGAGSIVTSGPLSAGIMAQSIGGGGGMGGAANPAMDQAHVSQSSATLGISIGGRNGHSGAGGTVSVTNTGTIGTMGDLSPGILAQSIGGGGGHGAVTIMSANTGVLVNVTLGADAGSGSWSGANGGQVTVNATTISTQGHDSPGVVAQSIGGGGGIAAVMSASYNTATGSWTSQTGSDQSGTQQVQFDFQGNAPNNSWAGLVNVTLAPTADTPYATITTQGRNSYGILAQAVGGGGGVIVSDYRVTTGTFFNAAPSADSNGAGVTVTTVGATEIATTGDGAVGIVAQSLSGGGIVNGMNGVRLVQVRLGHATSYGGTVTVNNSADIHVSGAYAHGIFAQSASLGGAIGQTDGSGFLLAAQTAGSCGSTCADNGQVTVNLNAGTIYVHGANAYGVVLVSQGNPTGTNNTTLNLTDGRIATDLNAAGAVFIGGADTNTVTIGPNGIVNANAAGLAFATWAADGSAGADPAVATIHNNGGSIMGSVVLGNGSTVVNGTGAQFAMGPVVNLGSSGSVTNSGTLEIGRARTIATTAMTGNLVQGSGGRMVVDTDHAARRADLLTVQGTAAIAGKVETRPISVTNAPLTVLTATGGVTLDPATTGSSSLAFNFRPETDGQSLIVRPRADFVHAAGGLSSMQRRVAGSLQAAWDQGGSLGGSGFAQLAGLQDQGSYTRALDTLSGQTVGAISASRFASSLGFVSNMQSCPAFVGESLLMQEESCLWARASGGSSIQDATGGSLGYRMNAESIQVGRQWQLAGNWFLGVSGAYERSRFTGEQGTSRVTGDSGLAGVALKYQMGAWLFSGTLDGGLGRYRSTRQIEVGDDVQSATASPEAWHLGATLRASYQAVFDGFYLKPSAELRALHVANGGYTEAGTSPFNLSVDAGSSATVAATAAVELGTRVGLGQHGTLHLFTSAGVTALGDDGWQANARFAQAPAGSPGFQATTPIPDLLGRFSVGANLYTTGNLELKLQYNGDVGEGFTAHTGFVRAAWRF